MYRYMEKVFTAKSADLLFSNDCRLVFVRSERIDFWNEFLINQSGWILKMIFVFSFNFIYSAVFLFNEMHAWVKMNINEYECGLYPKYCQVNLS